MRFALAFVTLIPIAVAGCEPPQTCSTCSDEVGDTGASDSTDDSSGDDVTSIESSDDSETDEVGTETETTEGDACEAATNDPMSDTSMTFEVENVGATAVFLAATDDCTANDFRLRQGGFDNGDDALWSSALASQGNECATMQGPCGFGCSNDDPEQFLRIEPGASAVLLWDGYWWETVTVDGGCLSPECTEPAMCNAGRQAGLGDMFGLEALAYFECTPGDFDCDCPQGETSCVIYSYGDVGGPSETFTQDFAFETGSMVLIQFGN